MRRVWRTSRVTWPIANAEYRPALLARARPRAAVGPAHRCLLGVFGTAVDGNQTRRWHNRLGRRVPEVDPRLRAAASFARSFGQNGAVEEAGEVLGSELLIDRNPDQVQLGCTERPAEGINHEDGPHHHGDQPLNWLPAMAQ